MVFALLLKMPKSSYYNGITNLLFLDYACYLHCLIEKLIHTDIILKTLSKALQTLFKFKDGEKKSQNIPHLNYEQNCTIPLMKNKTITKSKKKKNQKKGKETQEDMRCIKIITTVLITMDLVDPRLKIP